MRTLAAAVIGFSVAVLVPIIFFAVVGGSSALAFVFFFASLHVLIIGLPVFFIFHRFDLIRWWSTLIAGFIGGAIPMAVYSWPYDSKGTWSYTAWNGERMVQYVINGVPTADGWLSYIYGFTATALLGAASALGFWLTWRLLVRPNPSLNADAPTKRRAG